MGKGIFRVAFIILSIWSRDVMAQPTVTNEALVDKSQKFVLISFLQEDLQSMNGCHYNIFAAAKKKSLKELPGKGLSIATFLRNESVVEIIAGPLKQLKKLSSGPLKGKKVKIFLRTLISCPGALNGYSETISFSIKPKRKGTLTEVGQFLSEMKYHMRYYN